MKLPPIDGKKKKDGGKKKDDYPEHGVIMDAEDINKAIEGNKRLNSLILSLGISNRCYRTIMILLSVRFSAETACLQLISVEKARN